MKLLIAIVLFLVSINCFSSWEEKINNYRIPREFSVSIDEYLQMDNERRKKELENAYKDYIIFLVSDYRKKLKVDYNPFSGDWQDSKIREFLATRKMEERKDYDDLASEINLMVSNSFNFFKGYSFNKSLHSIYDIKDSLEEYREELNLVKKEIRELKLTLREQEERESKFKQSNQDTKILASKIFRDNPILFLGVLVLSFLSVVNFYLLSDIRRKK